MRYTRPVVSSVLTLAVLATSVWADTIVLKSGERIEGTVISENDKQLVLSVKISAGITDERKVAKADVDKVEKASPELEAYKTISTIQPGANSLAEGQYDPTITSLEAFIRQFPDSSRTPEIKKTVAAFEAEKKRVQKGEVKLDGQWYGKEEVEREKVQIGGRMAFAYMKSQAAGGDVIGALNTFAALDKAYPGTGVMPDAVDLARQLINSIKTSVERAIPEQKIRKEEFTKGVQDAGPAQRTDLLAAYKREQEMADAEVSAAEKSNRWVPFNRNSEKSLIALQSMAAKETVRLGAMSTDGMRQSVELARAAKLKAAVGDYEAADSTLKEAVKLWPVNELALRTQKEIAEGKTRKPQAAPAAAPATPAPAPAKPKHTSASTPIPAPIVVEAAPLPEPEKKPFYLTLRGSIAIVVGVTGVLAGANVLVKIKQRNTQIV